MVGKNKIFRTSDFGYYIPDVDATIDRYNEAIKKLQRIIAEQKDIINQKEREKEKAMNEIQRMHLQMSALEVPDMATVQESLILNQFKNRKKTPEQIQEEEKEEQIESPKSKKELLESIEEELSNTISVVQEEETSNSELNTNTESLLEEIEEEEEDDGDAFKIIV